MTFAVVIASVSRAADAPRRATAVRSRPQADRSAKWRSSRSRKSRSRTPASARRFRPRGRGRSPSRPPACLLRRGAVAAGAAATNAPVATASGAVRIALRDPNFLFLTAGFFACGFQLAFMGVHLPTYLGLCHIGANVGAAALATIGFFNIIGSFGFGRAADRVPPQLLLTVLYAVRATATGVSAIPISAVTTLAFAVVMGLTWLGTVPLTNAVIARLHGLPNLGALFGVCFVGHQLGSFFGALAGGLVTAVHRLVHAGVDRDRRRRLRRRAPERADPLQVTRSPRRRDARRRSTLNDRSLSVPSGAARRSRRGVVIAVGDVGGSGLEAAITMSAVS